MRPPRSEVRAWTALARQANADAKAARAPRKKAEGPRVKREHPRAGSRYEAELERNMKLEGLPTPELQHRFAHHLGRQYRFDFAWPERLLAVEVDGGRWLVRRGKNGRPVPVGFHNHIDDYRKLNLAARLGWRVMRFMPEMIRSGEAVQELKSWLTLPS